MKTLLCMDGSKRRFALARFDKVAGQKETYCIECDQKFGPDTYNESIKKQLKSHTCSLPASWDLPEPTTVQTKSLEGTKN